MNILPKWAWLLPFLFGCLGCRGTSELPPEVQSALLIVRAVGDAALRVDGYKALEKVAPELIPLIDTDADKVVTLAEVEALVTMATATPETFAGIAAAAYVLLRERR